MAGMLPVDFGRDLGTLWSEKPNIFTNKHLPLEHENKLPLTIQFALYDN